MLGRRAYYKMRWFNEVLKTVHDLSLLCTDG